MNTITKHSIRKVSVFIEHPDRKLLKRLQSKLRRRLGRAEIRDGLCEHDETWPLDVCPCCDGSLYGCSYDTVEGYRWYDDLMLDDVAERARQDLEDTLYDDLGEFWGPEDDPYHSDPYYSDYDWDRS